MDNWNDIIFRITKEYGIEVAEDISYEIAEVK